MAEKDVDRVRDPSFAPRLAVGIEALISALPTSYEAAVEVIMSTGLAEATARKWISEGLKAGYLKATGERVVIRTTVYRIGEKPKHSYKYGDDTRTLVLVSWPIKKETQNA